MSDVIEHGPPDGSSPLLPRADPERPVPWRTILAVAVVVLVGYVGFQLAQELGRVFAWLTVAAFFAVVLTPAVDFLQVRLRLRRGVATALVFITGIALIAGLLYALIRPIVDQVSEFVDSLPELVDDAKTGEGWVGELIT